MLVNLILVDINCSGVDLDLSEVAQNECSNLIHPFRVDVLLLPLGKIFLDDIEASVINDKPVKL